MSAPLGLLGDFCGLVVYRLGIPLDFATIRRKERRFETGE
jgi:hypothetical protein